MIESENDYKLRMYSLLMENNCMLLANQNALAKILSLLDDKPYTFYKEKIKMDTIKFVKQSNRRLKALIDAYQKGV